MDLPKIPECKKWNGNTNPEQDGLMKIQMGQPITQKDIDNLDCSFEFYKTAFTALKAINFSELKDEEVPVLYDYLNNIFSMSLILQNGVRFELLWRITWVADYNKEDDKVRDPSFLSCPPLDVVKRNGKYGRANTPNTTCLYLAENAQVAVFECKPKPGDRIILTRWRSIKDEPFILFQVNSIPKINLGLDKATEALQKKLYDSNQYFARIIHLISEFIGSEYVKDEPIISEKSYEYLYSAYFADRVLNSQHKSASPKTETGQYDGIKYPSIATKYKFDNVAIREESIHKLKPVFCQEFLIEKTGYDNFNGNLNQLPFQGKMLRESISITDRINWNDD